MQETKNEMQRKLTEKDTLAYLGEGAQLRIVKSIIEDSKLFINTHSYLNENSFTVPEIKQLVHVMNKFYDEKGLVPTYKDLEYTLKDACKTDAEISIYKDLISKLKSDNLIDGMATATEKGINYFKQLEAERVLDNGKASLKNSGYSPDRINHIQEELAKIEKDCVGNEDVMAGDLIDRVLHSGVNEIVPTGVETIDKAMNGGLPKKNLGLIIAGTGVGKTTFGSIISIGAAKKGFNVLHIFFEDTLTDIGKKYYANITGRYTHEFNKDNPELDVLANEILQDPINRKALYDHLKPVRMDNGSTTVEDIKNYIKTLINVKGWRPDMVVIDYLSCLKVSSGYGNEGEHQTYERAMKKIETMAQDLDLAIWVEQQTNRDAFKDATENDRIGNVQGSFRITQPASFIFYLKRNADEWNYASLYMDKSRGCTPTKWENFYFNNGTCTMDFKKSNDVFSTMTSSESLTLTDEEVYNNGKSDIF